MGRPKRSTLHLLFIVLAFATALFSAGLIFGRVLPLFLSSGLTFSALIRRGGAYYWITKLCSALLHASFVLVEMEGTVPYVLPRGTFGNWIQRGFLYAFVALPDVAETATVVGATSKTSSIKVMFGPGLTTEAKVSRLAGASVHVSSRGLAACGVAYLLMGVFCMKKKREECRKSYSERLQKYREELRDEE